VRALPRWIGWPLTLMLLMGISACTDTHPQSAATPPTPQSSATMGPKAGDKKSGGKKGAVVQRPDHVVVVILENEQRSSIIGSAHAPYLNKLAARGANLTHSYGSATPASRTISRCSPDQPIA
jgi:hypothetical protein